MSDGTEIYLEQASMAPFTTLVYAAGPNEDFKFSATVKFEVQVGMNLNNAKGVNFGFYKLVYKNGSEYCFNWPQVLTNQKNFETVEFTDLPLCRKNRNPGRQE